MAGVRFAARVADDLENISNWIARDNPERAKTFVQELRQACLELGLFPRIYPEDPHLGPMMRHRTVGNYVILYDVEDDDIVTVQAVVHGARDNRAPR